MTSAPRRTLLLSLYLLLSRNLAWFARLRLKRRLRSGKENGERLGERMGEPGLARPEGRLIWFHAASVGESLSLLELLRRLRLERPDLVCLVTTGTQTSAEMLATRLPEGCLHQFVPLDILPWMEQFLDHWRPDIAVWTESELWPAMIYAVHRRQITMYLINARISDRSFHRWRRFRNTAQTLLQRFDRVMAQDDLAARHLVELGVPASAVVVSGSLKEGATPLPHSEEDLIAFRDALHGRSCWLAASTHSGEEEVVLAAHRVAVRAHPGLLLILVPRHPQRADDVYELVAREGFRLARRSCGDPIQEDTDVYLADTLGELGIWYRAAPVCFVGGSLREIGGHNPYEPALLGSAILHGPHVRNFADVYRKLTQAGAAIEIRDAAEFGQTLVSVLPPDRAANMAAAAWDVCSKNAEVTNQVEALILDALDRGA
ncbi:MAG: 3-deoxy-D-manno-octulosonic acid transferase [Pseudomonadota bacterium]